MRKIEKSRERMIEKIERGRIENEGWNIKKGGFERKIEEKKRDKVELDKRKDGIINKRCEEEGEIDMVEEKERWWNGYIKVKGLKI